jgi:hypothetical protein
VIHPPDRPPESSAEQILSRLLTSRDDALRAQGHALAEALAPLSPALETLRRAMALLVWLSEGRAPGDYSLADIATGWDAQQVDAALYQMTLLPATDWPVSPFLAFEWQPHGEGLSVTLEVPRLRDARVVRVALRYDGGDAITVERSRVVTVRDRYDGAKAPLRYTEDAPAQARQCARCQYGQGHRLDTRGHDAFGRYATKFRTCTFREHYRDSDQYQGQRSWWDEWVCGVEEDEPAPPCPGFQALPSG